MAPARLAAMSGPPPKRKRPRTAGTVSGAREVFEGSSDTENSRHSSTFQQAATLDRLADVELQRGYAAEAERLSHLAAALRERLPGGAA
jgi:hypothetical protein